MEATDPERLLDVVLDAIKQTQSRAVIAAGWGGLRRAQLPPGVHVLDQAPHEWLFPRMAAVIHHGGAGTTAAALRAGRPSVICPFSATSHSGGGACRHWEPDPPRCQSSQ